jgi:hypothetical protein
LEAQAESVMASGTEAARAMEQTREEFTIRHATASPDSVPRERPRERSRQRPPGASPGSVPRERSRTQAVAPTNSATTLARRSPCCS